MDQAREIKLLIVDDSKVSRDLMKFIVEADKQIKVVGTASDGFEALDYISKDPPDVAIIDIVMPRMNGYELTRKIMETHPLPIIVVSGAITKEEITKTFKALEAGALAILEKPKGIGEQSYLDTARFVIETIKALAEFKISSSKQQPFKRIESKPGALRTTFEIPNQVEVIGIGSSIGGPNALRSILGNLSHNFPIPILIVQHIAAGFAQGFAEWLGESTKMQIKIAKNGERMLAGHVYLAPDRAHLEVVRGGYLKIQPQTTHEDYVPSIAKLFESMGETYGRRSLGILLTGTGKDGLRAVNTLQGKGGIVISQDKVGSQTDLVTSLKSLNEIISLLEHLASKVHDEAK